MSRIRIGVLLGLLVVIGLGVGCGAGQGSGAGEPQAQNAELKVGDKAPDFRLADHTGGYVRLSDFEGDKNVVVAFYPLAWTPV
jgi:cytochrome oxidase Cu insertion factor (SCO1/SenC/PrrC family)